MIFPKYRGDLLQAAVVVERMRAGAIEPLAVPTNPLDVLAQQIIAMVSMDPWDVEELYDVVRRAAPYRDLSFLTTPLYGGDILRLADSLADSVSRESALYLAAYER